MDPSITRRRFLRATGAATVGAASISVAPPRYSPVGRAEAIAPLALAGAAVAAGVAIGYATRYVQDKLTGPDVDAESYDETNADALHAGIEEDGIEMQYYDDQVFTNMRNALQLSENAAFSDAKYAAIEQWNLGNSDTDAKNAALDAVDSFYRVHQENLLEHVGFQVSKFEQMISDIEANGTLVVSDVFEPVRHDGKSVSQWDADGGNSIAYPASGHFTDYAATFVDGTTYQYRGLDERDSNSPELYIEPPDPDDDLSSFFRAFEVWPADGSGERSMLIDDYLYNDVWYEIESKHSNVRTEVSNWVDNVAASYEAGDIDLTDLLTASELAELSATETGYSFAAADLALLGIPGAEHKYLIELHTDEVTVEGTLYMEVAPDGGLEIGKRYSVTDFPGTVWLAYDYTKDDGTEASAVVGLEQDFTVLDAEARDGSDITEVTFTERNQQTTTTDMTELQKELERVRDLRQELEQERDTIIEDASGGGGALFGGNVVEWARNNPGKAVVGGGGTAVALKWLFGGAAA